MLSDAIATAQRRYDAVVIGSGPNGLAAAIALAHEGRSVLVLEAADTVGGGMRSSANLTRPGFVHDVCSAVHPMAAASPFFSSLPLREHGLEFIQPDAPLAHPLDDGEAVVLERSLDRTAERLGSDGGAYRGLMESLVEQFDELLPELLAPLRPPRRPLLMTRFGLKGVRSAVGLARARFRTPQARALFAGNAAHSIMPLEQWLTSAIGLVLSATGHAVGWPVIRGGSGKLAEALSSYLRSLGGEILTGRTVRTMADLPPANAYLFDVAPRHLARIARDRLAGRFVAQLERYRYGPGIFKLDWALSRPIPWKNPECLRAGTVHVCGTLDEVAAAERAAWSTTPTHRPFVLLAQQSLFDATRAPPGQQTGWAYCHVPSGCTMDMTDAIERQVERFAPGFRDVILARHSTSPAQFEAHNANYVGGDITGGVQDAWQLFTRPSRRFWNPYSTPNPAIFICSASTPPGGGVHGMCGYWAARAALRGALAR